MKTLSYSNIKNTSKAPLILVTIKKIKCESFDFVLLLSSFFLLFSHAYLNGIQYIQMICTPNDWSASRHAPFLVRAACELRFLSYGSKLMSWTLCICNLVHTYMHNLKTKGRTRMLHQRNDCFTIKTSIFWVRTICEILSVSYGFKHASQPLSSNTSCAYPHL